MQAYFGERGCEFDQASGILDSNSEEAWRETKMRPSSQYGGELTTASSKTKTPALQASKSVVSRSIKPCLHTQLPEHNKSYRKVSRGWGHLITWNGSLMGHFNSFSSSGGRNLNKTFPKIQMPGGLPGWGGGMLKLRFDWYITTASSKTKTPALQASDTNEAIRTKTKKLPFSLAAMKFCNSRLRVTH